MSCCVEPCTNTPVVEVDFHGTGRWYPYCRYHAYDKRGDLRWAIAGMRTRKVVRTR